VLAAMIPMALLTNTSWSKLNWEAGSAVYAIKDNIPRTVSTRILGCISNVWEIFRCAGIFKVMAGISFFPSLKPTLLSLFIFCLVLTGGPVATFGLDVPIRSIAQITIDDENRPLNYPSYLFYDPFMEELYLSNIGTRRVIVYGPDFFPRISIGRGRGLLVPYGGAVMSNGEVYICQPRSKLNPRNRITILNGAFFVDREIFLDDIPGEENLSPRNIAVSSYGIIYLVAYNTRGVIVLDNDGEFLRRIEPMDTLSSYAMDTIERERLKEEKLNKHDYLRDNCKLCMHKNPVFYDELVSDSVEELDLEVPYPDVEEIEGATEEGINII